MDSKLLAIVSMLASASIFAGTLGSVGCIINAEPEITGGVGTGSVSSSVGTESYCTGSPCVLSWKGYSWAVSDGSHAGGGTAQSIVTNKKNFYVDTQTGYLHTRISKNGGTTWNTAEAFATTNTGF